MNRSYYTSSIKDFLNSSPEEILGVIVTKSEFPVEAPQREAWLEQINILKDCLINFQGFICFEYSIPRLGSRADVIVIISNVLFVLEFKVGSRSHDTNSYDQVFDYGLDLKNFHDQSHNVLIAPVIISTLAKESPLDLKMSPQEDNLLFPVRSNGEMLRKVIVKILDFASGPPINIDAWINGRYSPTPTIIEAATALYAGHSVDEISRSDAASEDLIRTTNTVAEIIKKAREENSKSICFITGVPGSGKTLIGLNLAIKYMADTHKSRSVYLSGNGPLVDILREALARNTLKIARQMKIKLRKQDVSRTLKLIIQNVHHFRDEYLKDQRPPYDHVAIFDEAQRAWNQKKTADFMKRRKRIPDFNQSEPKFLLSCMDRHDWAVVVCLVGGGQEINTGEAGISEWLASLKQDYPKWKIFLSDNLNEVEYQTSELLNELKSRNTVYTNRNLHLSVSRRSFRAENVSKLVNEIIERDVSNAKKTYNAISKTYPILLTRNLDKAKAWLKLNARGSERYGLICSSKAERLKPHAINVKAPMNPINWFLEGKDHVNSSYFLEEVATEFHVQGLELDWTCITWDGDLRFSTKEWLTFRLRSMAEKGTKWNNVNNLENKRYLKNAYRVLLTRARQGMIIVVPEGDDSDPTRNPQYYDNTFNYLKEIGFNVI